MVDKDTRKAIADSISSYLSGRIDNWLFDDTLFSLTTTDDLCLEIRRQIWLFYDDTRLYFNVGDKALKISLQDILCRWELNNLARVV